MHPLLVNAEYGNDFDVASSESDLHWILSERLRCDRQSNDYWMALSAEFIREFFPKLEWEVGTPGNHARLALRRHRKFYAAGWAATPSTFTTGRAMAHRTLRKGIGQPDPRLASLQLTTPQALFWEIPRSYKTLAGRLTEWWPDDEGTKSLVLALTSPWLPIEMAPDQLEATDYHQECVRLQATKAGRKAKQLLLENLRDDQAQDYLRLGYFHVMSKSKRRYIIQRGFTNGNICRVELSEAQNRKLTLYPRATYCYHAHEPHACDDVILAQKLVIETDEDEFLAKANMTKPPLDGRLPLHLYLRAR